MVSQPNAGLQPSAPGWETTAPMPSQGCCMPREQPPPPFTAHPAPWAGPSSLGPNMLTTSAFNSTTHSAVPPGEPHHTQGSHTAVVRQAALQIPHLLPHRGHTTTTPQHTQQFLPSPLAYCIPHPSSGLAWAQTYQPAKNGCLATWHPNRHGGQHPTHAFTNITPDAAQHSQHNTSQQNATHCTSTLA